MRIKIFEMSRDLKDLENVLAAHVGNVVENWCLVYASFCDQAYEKYRHHWLTELQTNLKTSLNSVRVALSRYSDKSVYRRIDEAYLKDYLGNNYDFVYDDLEYKFLHTERMSKDLLSAATRAWIQEGCSEVIRVLKGGTRLYDYIVDMELKDGA